MWAGISGGAEKLIELPKPRLDSEASLEQVLKTRRSVRSFLPEPLSLVELSQLLWATQGISSQRLRTVPSAGALYPLEVHVVVGKVTGLESGVYRYHPRKHGLEKTVAGDVREPLASAAYGQSWIGEAAIALVVSGVYKRTTAKYGERGVRYVHMEAGHAAQNLYLQAEALGLGTTTVGAFTDGQVKRLLHMREEEQPLSIMPVGRPE